MLTLEEYNNDGYIIVCNKIEFFFLKFYPIKCFLLKLYLNLIFVVILCKS